MRIESSNNWLYCTIASAWTDFFLSSISLLSYSMNFCNLGSAVLQSLVQKISSLSSFLRTPDLSNASMNSSQLNNEFPLSTDCFLAAFFYCQLGFFSFFSTLADALALGQAYFLPPFPPFFFLLSSSSSSLAASLSSQIDF